MFRGLINFVKTVLLAFGIGAAMTAGCNWINNGGHKKAAKKVNDTVTGVTNKIINN